MIEWRYWRWQIRRNILIGSLIWLSITAAGLQILKLLPNNLTAQSRLVLETPLALNTTPKAARAAQDIQHLQVVMHALRNASDLGEDELAFAIASGRDKPSFLTVTGHSLSQPEAVQLAKTFARRAIAASDQLQRERIDASLMKLAELENMQAQTLAAAKLELAEHLSVPKANTDLLKTRLEALQSARTAVKPQQQSPQLAKLRQTLAEASVLFSEKHPTIKLLQAKIATIETPKAKTADRELDAEIAQAASDLADAQRAQSALNVLAQNVETMTVAHKRAQDALTDAQLRGEASFARLKLVQDAHIEASSPSNKRLAAQLAILAFGLASALGVVALRIRMDRRIRRPADFATALGIVPFATLPDLGPSLA